MAKYFNDIRSLEDLKAQYRALLKANHPDNGGNIEIMKEINIEYDALFPVWKNRKEAETGFPVQETADSTRKQFYTMFGWEGSNHDWNRSLKEVAHIVRTYVKEKYPTYKFSVRTSYASMCQELHVELKESPIEIYKTFEELTDEDFQEIGKRIFHPYNTDEMMNFLNAPIEEKRHIIKDSESVYKNILNDITRAVIRDVDDFVKSYNFQDCDGMIDYFHVDFYYFGCCRDNGCNVKIVPKIARIKNRQSKPSKTKKAKETKQTQPETLENTTRYTYKVTQGQDTRDGSMLWVVRIMESLDKGAYIAENKRMKELGGYYSKFKHGFIFRFDPTEKLVGDITPDKN